jgi:hypothetical protein
MSLNAREQRTLAAIEDRVSGSDPELASLLATFTRLTSGEEMPAREQIPAGRRLPGALRQRRSRQQPPSGPLCPHARQLHELRGWSLACLLLWLAISAGMVAAAVALGGGGPQVCPSSWVVACTGQGQTHSPRAPIRDPAASPFIQEILTRRTALVRAGIPGATERPGRLCTGSGRACARRSSGSAGRRRGRR